MHFALQVASVAFLAVCVNVLLCTHVRYTVTKNQSISRDINSHSSSVQRWSCDTTFLLVA